MYGYPMSMLPQEFADLNRAERMEKARRLSRYDEAIRLLREIASYEPLSDSDGGFVNTWNEIEVFLAALAPAKEECTPHNHHWSWGRCLDCTQPDTAPPSEMPPQDEVKAVAHNVRECGSDEAAALILALSLVKWRSQPAPTPVRMTPALEFILKRADFAVLQDRDDDRVDEAYADELEKMIAAVRAQASQPQGVKMRGLIMQAQQCAVVLDNRGAPTNAEALRLWADAALAELDAAEWKVTG